MSEYFCGWYFRCCADNRTLAVIPAFHWNNGGKSCSLQVITDDGAWNVPFPYQSFRKRKKGIHVAVDDNLFTEKGMRMELHTDSLNIRGCVRFGRLSPLRYDIMGPFRFVPFMECRHSVFSMMHTVNGVITVNGTKYLFKDGTGYMEGDRGKSFPREYAWTQCSFADGSLMLSVAEIPVGPFRFTGIISAVLWRGREYRIATYLGARAVKIKDGEVVIRQRGLTLRAKLIKKNPHPLFAPEGGAMTRTIRESASCLAAYRMEENGDTLFDFETSGAAFEYEYEKAL